VREQNILVDGHGRRVHTLRISLTDRCNFRCVYCTPAGGFAVQPRAHELSAGEVARLARVTAAMGVTRYRLTGGEPLVRRDIVDVVRALRPIAGVREISITTNGSALAPLARPLRDAGLDRINVSLDSLDPARFDAVTRTRAYDRVRAGVAAALEAGFPVKLNVVVMRGMTEDEIVRFVELAHGGALEVRFLEFMPLCGSDWSGARVLPIADVRRAVRRRFRLEALPRDGHPAEIFAVDGGPGRVGFIAPLSEPFCNDCSRIRVSAAGDLRPCLFSTEGAPLGPILRNGAGDAALAAAIREAVRRKPRGSRYADAPFGAGDVDARADDGGPMIRSVGG